MQIRKRLGVPDPKTEARIVRVFRAALRPRGTAGRSPDTVTVRAAEMWTAGMSDYAGSRKRRLLRQNQRSLWQRIYREVLPGFAGMDRLTRQHRHLQIVVCEMKAYLHRRGHKSARGIRLSIARSRTPPPK